MGGEGRAAIFGSMIPPAAEVSAPHDARRMVMESGYSTPELNAAFEAIVEFWLPVLDGAPYPNYKAVRSWLADRHGLEDTAAARVDRLIRLEDAKSGGRKAVTQKGQQQQ